MLMGHTSTNAFFQTKPYKSKYTDRFTPFIKLCAMKSAPISVVAAIARHKPFVLHLLLICVPTSLYTFRWTGFRYSKYTCAHAALCTSQCYSLHSFFFHQSQNKNLKILLLFHPKDRFIFYASTEKKKRDNIWQQYKTTNNCWRDTLHCNCHSQMYIHPFTLAMKCQKHIVHTGPLVIIQTGQNIVPSVLCVPFSRVDPKVFQC